MASSTSPRPQAEMAPTFRDHRPMVVGGDQPETPYPMLLEGVVTRGFGRGARFLGIPTANLPDSSLQPLNDLQMTGIYYGFARIHPSTTTPHPTAPSTPSASGTTTPSTSNQKHQSHASPLSATAIQSIPAATAPYPPDSVPGDIAPPKRLDEEDGRVWPMVMSVGWNPYFKNEKITAEVHIIHPFSHDFYGHDMTVLVLGYIRPELDYVSKDALVQDIQTDVKVALNSLARPEYAKLALDPRLAGFRHKLGSGI